MTFPRQASTLIALLAAALFSLLPCRADPAASSLTLDGVKIAMSYREVLEARGRPRSLRTEDGFIIFEYPAPKSRPEATEVWFSRGKAVFCSGYTLEENGEPLFLYGLAGSVLEERFGATQTLNAFARWWPSPGVILTGTNNFSASAELRAPLGLRDLSKPIEWDRGQSQSEPWIDDKVSFWTADDITLGMPEDRARKLAGKLDVVYEAGYVRAVRNPPSALLNRVEGSINSSINFLLGEAPQLFGAAKPLQPVENGQIAPAPGARIALRDGKVAKMLLRLDDNGLFQALKSSKQPAIR